MKRSLASLASAAALIVALCSSCASDRAPLPSEIPAGVTARELIQKAQAAADDSAWKTARAYYAIAADRFADDLGVVCTCEYELAFIEYKVGNYAAAKAGFEALLARYDSPDAALLPQEYKTLAQKILDKTEEKLAAQKHPAAP